jgi:hypothetical protein
MMVRLELEAWLWSFLEVLEIGDLVLPSFVCIACCVGVSTRKLVSGHDFLPFPFSFSLFLFSEEALVDEKNSSQEIRILVHIAISTTSSSHQ